jgi:hypothetical protein
MGAERFLVSRATGVIGVLAAGAVAAGCATAVAATPASPPGRPGTAAPAVAPSAVPVLGRLTLGTFPATTDGTAARTLCEQWAGLRGQYIPQLRHDTPFQLERWFSVTPQWLTAFAANTPLKTDPAYLYISTAFGLVSTAAAASVPSARLLDAACTAAD